MRRRLLVLAGAVALAAALCPAPPATARVGVAPGMAIVLESGGACTLGFLAGNDAGRRLGVTAGHCAQGVGELVYNKYGDVIGEVVAQQGDGSVLADGFGVTILVLADDVEIPDALFTRYANPRPGDPVHKYGSTTAETGGTIGTVTLDADYPRYSVMRSTLTASPGDSGSPWYGEDESGPVLYGITIGHLTDADNGAELGAYGFPIDALVAYVRDGSGTWGPGFTPAGR